MPIYSFKCPNGHEFEELTKVGTEKMFCLSCCRDSIDSGDEQPVFGTRTYIDVPARRNPDYGIQK